MKINKIFSSIQCNQIIKNNFQVKKFKFLKYNHLYNKYKFSILMNKGIYILIYNLNLKLNN